MHRGGRSSGDYHRGGRRGGRGGRGGHGRGFGRGRYFNGEGSGNNFDQADGDMKQRGRGRGRHPAGLTGREIGLWYARNGQKNKERNEFNHRSVVSVHRHLERDITDILQNKRQDDDEKGASASADNIPFHDLKMNSPTEKEPQYFKNEAERNEHMYLQSVQEDPTLVVGSCSDSKKSILTENGSTVHPAKKSKIDCDPVENITKGNNALSSVNIKVENEKMSGCKLIRNRDLDEKLLAELQEKQHNPRYNKMLEFRRKLPSFAHREELLTLMENNQVLVISGETGCGKTTQVAQFILDEEISKGRGSMCNIICTQPRRISAISVAERVAAERAESCGNGNSCGFQIRLEHKLPREQGSILYCTTGVLLRRMISDKCMENVSHVVLDEIHERDVMSDFLLIIIKDLLPLRPDLKVILMSATLNAEMFSKYFGDCPMTNIPGYTFPVEEMYLEDIVQKLGYRGNSSSQPYNKKPYHGRPKKDWEEKMEKQRQYEEYLHSIQNSYDWQTIETLQNMNFEETEYKLIEALITHICNNLGDGAVLVFLPGWDNISKLNDLLLANPVFGSNRFLIIPLHSLMPTANQTQVFERPPPGVRKIVIATNIAETSITIDDVVFVINGGKTKIQTYDVESDIRCLQPCWVSKASARQRRGRAGRVQEGFCFHLYTHHHEEQFEEYQLAEMLRTPLDTLSLQIKILKLGYIQPFLNKAMESPASEAIHKAISSLRMMNALNDKEELTSLGYHLARLPVAPKVGRMILFGAIFSCLDPVLIVAASLDFKDPFYVPLHKQKESDEVKLRLSQDSKSDHIMLINAFQGWERSKRDGREKQFTWNHFLSINTLRMISNMKGQFARHLKDIGFLDVGDHRLPVANRNSNNINLVKAVICAGLYPNVAKIQLRHHNAKRPPGLMTQNDGKVCIHPKSVNSEVRWYESQWVIYHEKMRSTKVYLYDCSMISPFPLLFFGGELTVCDDQGHDTIQVDTWIRFHAPTRIAEMVKDLRKELDALLQKKIDNPKMELVAGRYSQSHEERVLNAIIELISSEELKMKGGS